MANTIYSQLKKGETFSVHRIELRDENDALCGTIAYVMNSQVFGQYDEIDKLILSAIRSQYPKSSDSPIYFKKDTSEVSTIESQCGINIRNGVNVVMNIDIKTEAPIDISGHQISHLSQMPIPLMVYDVQSSFITENISVLSSQSIVEYASALKELTDYLCQYQEFLQ